VRTLAAFVAGVSPIAHGSSPPDFASRALGGLALVGPAFVVVEVLVCLLKTELLSLAYHVEFPQICAHLPAVLEQLNYAV
jgi:hypothetical protein